MDASHLKGAADSLFFAGSDDEELNVQVNSVIDSDEDDLKARLGAHAERLFFEGVDEDLSLISSRSSPSIQGNILALGEDQPDLEMDIPTSDAEGPRSSSVATMSSDDGDAPTLQSDSARPSTKRRRLSLPPLPSSSKMARLNLDASAPASKADRHPADREMQVLASHYLGSFIIGNAWATAKGKGYVNPGDEILIVREDQTEKPGFKGPPSTKLAGKGASKGATYKDKTKQLTLSAMVKPQPSRPPRPKVDTIVRLTNVRGFEFGRIPTDVSSWISTLMDMNMVQFRQCTMLDCPAVLHSGADLMISLCVDVLPSAFGSPEIQEPAESGRVIFEEGRETLDEQILRERKKALLRLFDAISLRPSNGPGFTKYRNEQIKRDSIQNMRNRNDRVKKTEIVGDGEEIEVEEGEELSENDLDTIYKKAQLNDRMMAEMEPPDSFNLTLRGYQKQALHWMHSLETGNMAARDASSMHPLWSEYAFPADPHDPVIDLTRDDTPFYFNPYSGELSLEFPRAERKCRGGILADEMGMGKTIMLSALIQTLRELEPTEGFEKSAQSKARQLKLNEDFRTQAHTPRSLSKGPSATLIVAPTSLLAQWAEELQRSSKPGTIKVLVWHGQNRRDLESLVADDYEGDTAIKAVVTSYGVLVSEHAKSQRSGAPPSLIFEIEWLRVVLDEAHHCKSRTSKTARAVYSLRARRRWAVTGTPIVNKLEDLFSLLKFLGFKPWSDYAFFRSFVTLPFLDRDPKAIEIVQVILESILLRREKGMRDADGKKIVDLPAKEITVDVLEFSPLERKIYDSIYVRAKRDFDRLNAKGLVSRNYTHILAMLMRLRRAVLHPSLVLSLDQEEDRPSGSGSGRVDVDDLTKNFTSGTSAGENKNAFAESVLAKLETDDDNECPICFDVMQAPMIIPGCMHQCCKDCIVAFLVTCEERGEERRCPTCSQGPVNESDLLEVVRSKKSLSAEGMPDVILRRNDFRSSTKLNALADNLRRLRDQDPCFRAVVFSQFTSFLDLIEIVLQRERFDFSRFDGSMDIKKRNTAVAEFRTPSRKSKVLIISLKAGGVGLNLTAANHVFMMDCWWNAATENQAIDRVHRIGQDKIVYVKHFIVSNTIEGKILQIQKRKTAIIKEAFRSSGGGQGGDPESLENLKIMFGDD